jgi:hypothetical protein
MPQPSPSGPEPELQFRRAVPLDGPPVDRCAVCKNPIDGAFYQAAGHKVCPVCAQRIRQGQQGPAHASLAKAALFGGAAALAGCLIYAAVAIVLHVEVGLVSILVGYMVGKSIRRASGGLGGRPQQILAVALTYFAVTTTWIPIAIYENISRPHPSAASSAAAAAETGPRKSVLETAAYLLLLTAASPFLGLRGGVSGLLTLAIIFFGISTAWRLTGRMDILVAGPYETPPRPT